MFLVIVLYMLMASTFTFAKAALFYAPPILFIGVRMTIAGLICLVISCLALLNVCIDRNSLAFGCTDYLFHIYGAYILEFIGFASVSSSKACLLYNLTPFVTASFSYLLFGTRFTHKQFIALCIGFVGFIPLYISSSPQPIRSGSLVRDLIRKLLIIGAVCGQSGLDGHEKTCALDTHHLLSMVLVCYLAVYYLYLLLL